MAQPKFKHGLHGYKVYRCRCAVCSYAMSSYAKSRYVPVSRPLKAAKKVEPQVLTSWWLDRTPAGFTAFVEAAQYARMKASRFGQSGLAKPISTDEVSR